MKEYLKWTAIAVAVLGVIVTSTWLWRDSVWRERIANTPALRDTTVTIERDTVQIPVIRADTVYVSRIDSSQEAPRWWTVKADTTLSGAKIHVEYNSPLPLSPRGFFSDVSVQLPARIDSVRTVYVTEKVIVRDEVFLWQPVVIAGLVGMVSGALLLAAVQ